jgi:hypothetical protein
MMRDSRFPLSLYVHRRLWTPLVLALGIVTALVALGLTRSPALAQLRQNNLYGSIGDTVFQDDNGNTTQNAGEPGIPGVTVNLNDPGTDGTCGTADDVFIASDVTDANGNYLFTDLPADTYCADPDETTVPAGYALTTANDPQTVNLAAQESYLEADFGYEPGRLLGDRVWYDQDQDGIQDAGEPAYNGVTVDLYDNGTCSGTPIASTTSGAAGPDGYFAFSGLTDGDYCLQFGNVPAGWSPSPANQGADDTVNSDANPSGQIPGISLSANDPDEDFGIYVAGSVGDVVTCADTSSGLADITVSLFEDFDCDGTADGPAIATTQTDANGFYQFTGLEVAQAGDAANQTCYIVAVDPTDPDLGICSEAASQLVYNPSLDSASPHDESADFLFEYPPVGGISVASNAPGTLVALLGLAGLALVAGALAPGVKPRRRGCA